ncbi:MAG: DUF3465 domain-containing protein [Wenzhouxiangella sp.]|nr:DUF3465 domain-containing protein [Wenzhouxiangella sp.]MCH8476416.1 DUF3465 domain-containing protein [Wenzhouxiangella sp.]
MLRRYGVVLVSLLIAVGLVGCGGEEMPDNARLKDAFVEGRTGIWVSGHGTVVRELGADASQQRFLIRIDEELSVVIRHNFGESRPVPVERGDVIAFQGRYEFHGGGGEVHFTHADASQPGGGGWIRHKGQLFN